MKKKNLVSLSVAAIFVVLGSTGLLLYVKQKPHAVEMTHTIFGLLFISLAIFHIVNNWGSLRAYAKDRQEGGIRRELWIVTIAAVVMVTLAATEVLEPVAEFGRIFAKPSKKGPAGQVFQEKQTLDSAAGRPVTFILQKSPDRMRAILSVMLANSEGQPIATLFDPGTAGEGPPEHLLLHTRIAGDGPFRILVKSSYEGSETLSDTPLPGLQTGVYALAAGEGTGLARALLEVR